ncbi:MAG: TIM barrel protein [Anaerolineae bacterium]|nr:TIM barrel protein [Anaerolineae bacterium]
MPIRLGVRLAVDSEDPEEIARAYVAAAYSAAVCPPLSLADPAYIQAVHSAFARHDVLLAEVGCWNNLLAPDAQEREANLQANIEALAIADEVGALCCVNIAGTYNASCWDGPHPRNLGADAFTAIVENTRRIVDAVQPRRARYTLEGMPWALPDGPDSYLALLKAVDRPAFAVHLDPVNWINSPARYYDNAALLRDSFQKLGPWIVSCHAKDIVLRETLTVHLDERPPCQGALDYTVYLRELSRQPGDVPLILEHLPQAEYPAARGAIVSAAARAGVPLYRARHGQESGEADVAEGQGKEA